VAILLVAGLWSGAGEHALFIWQLQAGRPLPEVMAMTFVSLVLIQFFNAYNCRSDRTPIVRAAVRESMAEPRGRLGVCCCWRHRLRAVLPAGRSARSSLGWRDWLLTSA
jgi:hypothetical protein